MEIASDRGTMQGARKAEFEVAIQTDPIFVTVYSNNSRRAQWSPNEGVSPKQFRLHGHTLALSVETANGITADRAQILSLPNLVTLLTVDVTHGGEGTITLPKL